MKDEKENSEETCTPLAPEPATDEEILAYWTEERLRSARPLPVPSPDGEAPAKNADRTTDSDDKT
jgi:hypothetical protein